MFCDLHLPVSEEVFVLGSRPHPKERAKQLRALQLFIIMSPKKSTNSEFNPPLQERRHIQMDPVDINIITTFQTEMGTFSVGEVKASGFTPGAKFNSEAVYTWDDPEGSQSGTSDASGHGTVDHNGVATYYCLLGPVSGGTLTGTIKEHSAEFEQVVNW